MMVMMARSATNPPHTSPLLSIDGTDGRTDGRALDRYIDPDPHTTRFCSVLFCSLAVLDPRVGHTMDALSPFIYVLCHSG